jgi:polyphosphate kinase
MAKRTEIRNLNRELNWIEFDRRVLHEATDPSVPLLERLKFLAISDANLDEFFMVRVGGLQMLVDQGISTPDMSGLTPAEQLKAVHARVLAMLRDQYACLDAMLEPALAEAGIVRVAFGDLDERQSKYLSRLFAHEIFPIITPIGLDPGRPLPLLANLYIHVAVRLSPAPGEKRARLAVIPLVPTMDRFIRLPAEGGYHYILLEDAIAGFVARLFPNDPVLETSSFKITRNADMSVAEDGAGDLLSQMAQVLDARKISDCVRLEVHAGMSGQMLDFLEKALSVAEPQTYRVPGPLRLSDLMRLGSLDGYDEHKYESWPPQTSPDLDPRTSMFSVIAKRDLIFFHPYESFEPVLRFIEEAALDPDVLAIKQILYRVSKNSPIVAALRRAAERGKYVTVIVELKARFDEARNIEWARMLERAGAQVIYGVKGLKTHAKVALVVRRESRGVVRYVHFGTGNYNESTAKLYSDVSYLTSNEELGSDASSFFNAVTGYTQPQKYLKIHAAPMLLREAVLNAIDAEIERKKHGHRALIMAKVNSLADAEIIEALYKASQAGVRVLLNIRGICCLRPGVKGLSDNISVVSIVDRYLEHSRILYFLHGGDEHVFISSADWMPRNLDRRVELLVPVDDPDCKRQLIDALNVYFQDTVKARRLLPDGSYESLFVKGRRRNMRSQEALYLKAKERTKKARQAKRTTFEPHRPADAEE